MPYQLGWLMMTVAAYFLQAVAAILDKFLLTQRIQRPSTYTFWVGVFGLGAFVLAPFGFFVPVNSVMINAFVSGVAFTFALFFFYIAMQSGEASRVTPIVGALSPIFVFFLSKGFLGETLSRGEFVAFLILVAGSILISISHKEEGGRVNSRDMKIFGWAAAASFLFGVTYVFEKAVFNNTHFINGFIWTRIGGFFGALPFLFFSQTRSSIFEAPRAADRITIGTFLGNKLIGALGFFFLALAISLSASVSLVNALQGVEYALVFFIALFLSKKKPAILEEEVTPRVILEKVFAILLIAAGLAILAFFSPR